MLTAAMLMLTLAGGAQPLVLDAAASPGVERVHRGRPGVPAPVPVPPRFRSPISLGVSWVGRTMALVGALTMAAAFVVGFLSLFGALVLLVTQAAGPASIPLAALLFVVMALCILAFILGLAVASVGGTLEFVGRMLP